MLFFMVTAKPHQSDKFGIAGLEFAKQTFDARRHVMSICQDLIQTRTRDQAALRPQVLVTNGVVIGIEEYPKRWIKRFKCRFETFENEGFKEPAGVR